MNILVVRFGEIGTKSSHVRRKMIKVLRQRIEDRIENEEIDYNQVSACYSRIIVETCEASEAAEHVSEIPGVSNVSPAYRTEPDIPSIKKEVQKLEIGETFGVDSNRSGRQEFDTQELNTEIGSYIEELTGASVDLDNPATWVEIDVRDKEAYIFKERFEGPDGYPVGTQGSYAALVSGGIDSPVAAYRMMVRGADIVPIYFYNKPVAAEDHLLRFKSSVRELKRYNPSKDWEFYRVDMEEVNETLLGIDRGRMVVHRMVMIKVAEKIAEREGLQGVVTGESLGQKSSQTALNIELTSSTVSKPVLRPLLTESKNSIVEQAKEIDTFEKAEVDSACRSMSPENPATSINEGDLEVLKSKVDVEKMTETALRNSEKTNF